MVMVMRISSEVLAQCLDLLEALFPAVVEKLVGSVTTALSRMSNQRDDEGVIVYVESEALFAAAVVT